MKTPKRVTPLCACLLVLSLVPTACERRESASNDRSTTSSRASGEITRDANSEGGKLPRNQIENQSKRNRIVKSYSAAHNKGRTSDLKSRIENQLSKVPTGDRDKILSEIIAALWETDLPGCIEVIQELAISPDVRARLNARSFTWAGNNMVEESFDTLKFIEDPENQKQNLERLVSGSICSGRPLSQILDWIDHSCDNSLRPSALGDFIDALPSGPLSADSRQAVSSWLDRNPSLDHEIRDLFLGEMSVSMAATGKFEEGLELLADRGVSAPTAWRKTLAAIDVNGQDAVDFYDDYMRGDAAPEIETIRWLAEKATLYDAIRALGEREMIADDKRILAAHIGMIAASSPDESRNIALHAQEFFGGDPSVLHSFASALLRERLLQNQEPSDLSPLFRILPREKSVHVEDQVKSIRAREANR